MTIWHLDPRDPAEYRFALVTPGPDFRLWDWTAGAYETAVVPMDPAKHLKSISASVPLGLMTCPIPDAARPEAIDSIGVVIYKAAGTGWAVVGILPIETLTDAGPVSGDVFQTTFIMGR